MKQLLTVIGSSIYAFGFTYVMLWVINKITRVRTTEGEEEAGLGSTRCTARRRTRGCNFDLR